MTGPSPAFNAPPTARVLAQLEVVEALLETTQQGQGGLPRGERSLLLKGVAQLKDHLRRPAFRCPVFGITKAGKSTLLNALLGQELLASSNVPITRVGLDLVHSHRVDALKLNHDYGVTRWLMQFGASAEVLAPDRLRTELLIQFAAAAAQYGKG